MYRASYRILCRIRLNLLDLDLNCRSGFIESCGDGSVSVMSALPAVSLGSNPGLSCIIHLCRVAIVMVGVALLWAVDWFIIIRALYLNVRENVCSASYETSLRGALIQNM